MSKCDSYTDCQGWDHEYYESPNGSQEYVCKKDGIVITNIRNFVIIKCSPRSVVDKIDWLLAEIADSDYNNADISMVCDVYTGEYIRVDICVTDGEYNVFDKNNMLLFSDILNKNTVKKLDKLVV
jgi:hypothetical protein